MIAFISLADTSEGITNFLSLLFLKRDVFSFMFPMYVNAAFWHHSVIKNLSKLDVIDGFDTCVWLTDFGRRCSLCRYGDMLYIEIPLED